MRVTGTNRSSAGRGWKKQRHIHRAFLLAFARSRRRVLCGFGVILLCEPVLTRFGLLGTAVAISMAGVFSFGPDTLLSGAGAQDIGEPKATATASGLVDGIGHLGAIFSPYVVVFVSQRYGWDRRSPSY